MNGFKVLQVLTMVLVSLVCLALIIPGYVVEAVILIVFVAGVWALASDYRRREP
jgi:hypothetical protein